jgi:predicted N-formylglutamate amidohydrolase
VLYNRDPRFAQILMELLHREEGLVVGDNEPYSVTDASDYPNAPPITSTIVASRAFVRLERG